MKIKSNLAELHEGLESRKLGPATEQLITRQTSERATVLDEKKRILRFVASDESQDRHETVIDSGGWDVDNYMKNPVFLWCHDHNDLPLGQAVNCSVQSKRLLIDVQFAPREVYERADVVYQLYLGGYLRANSVGFLPMEWEWMEDADGQPFALRFTKQELWEDSACPVPSNPNALVLAVHNKSISKRDAADYVAHLAFSCLLDFPGYEEAMSESVSRIAKSPAFEADILCALRSLGAKRPASTEEPAHAAGATNWAAPLEKLRAFTANINQKNKLL